MFNIFLAWVPVPTKSIIYFDRVIRCGQMIARFKDLDMSTNPAFDNLKIYTAKPKFLNSV